MTMQSDRPAALSFITINPRDLPDDSTGEIVFGCFDDTGCDGEVSIRWATIRGECHPRLTVFQDAWHMLPTVAPVLERLSDRPSWTLQQVRELLLESGYEDRTRPSRFAKAGEVELQEERS